MHNSPLIRTLQLLRQEEIDTLYLFVQSPVFNTVRPEETRNLFEFLKNHYPHFNHASLDREQGNWRCDPARGRASSTGDVAVQSARPRAAVCSRLQHGLALR